jgi:hypothetical protein
VLAGEDTAALETDAAAGELLDACIAELGEAGVPVSGEIVRSFGSHADVAARILRRAGALEAGAIVVGPDSHRSALPAGVTAHIAGHAPSHVIVINPRAGALGRPLAVAAAAADVEHLWERSSAPLDSVVIDH